jgi:hypothetical protein
LEVLGLKRWHSLARRDRGSASRRSPASAPLLAAFWLLLALFGSGCLGGPHPIPPEVLDDDGMQGAGRGGLGGAGGVAGIQSTGGVGGVAGFGAAGGSGGTGGQDTPTPDAGVPLVESDGGLDAGLDASDDDAGSVLGE